MKKSNLYNVLSAITSMQLCIIFSLATTSNHFRLWHASASFAETYFGCFLGINTCTFCMLLGHTLPCPSDYTPKCFHPGALQLHFKEVSPVDMCIIFLFTARNMGIAFKSNMSCISGFPDIRSDRID